MSEHILYQSEDASIWVIDLPTSIARAQSSIAILRSVPGPLHPYITPEPRGTKRDAILAAIPLQERHYHETIQKNLYEVLDHCHRRSSTLKWCCTRQHVLDDEIKWRPKTGCIYHANTIDHEKASPPVVLSPNTNSLCCFETLHSTVVHNPQPARSNLVIRAQERFIIPPGSTVLCSNIELGLAAFRTAVQCLTPIRHFDLILLDPPWSNRSVRHSRAYRTSEDQPTNPFTQILPLLAKHLTADGYLAVWITNKAAIRSEVLEICCYANLHLVEEWIWLKITTNGEPVTPLDGIWRRPYEILLLFRHNEGFPSIARRVCIAVPDIHSRKPNLKCIFDTLLPSGYLALEVFARSLTAGWWSWGDEVLMFQHESQWY